MSDEDWKQQMKSSIDRMQRDLDIIKESLVGDLSGKRVGALHLIQTHNEFINCPNNPHNSAVERINRLEGDRKRAIGFVAACAAIGGLVGFVCNAIISIFKK